MPRRFAIPVVLACGLAGLCGGTSRAAPVVPPPNGVELRWQAPGGCPMEAALAARLRELLGDAPLELEAVASVEQRPGAGREERWRLDLRMRWAGGSDDRVLFARDCPALADATLVLVAVLAAPLVTAPRLATAPASPVAAASTAPAPAIEPALPIEPGEPEPAVDPGEPEVSVSAVVVPGPVRAAAPAPAPVRRRGGFMRVAGVLGYGVLRDGDFGVALAGGGLLRRLRIEGELTYLPARTHELAARSGVGVVGGTMALAAGTVRVCPRFLGPTVELSLCGAVEAGASWSRSLGLAPRRSESGPWLAFALGGALDWWFSPQLGLHVGVEGMAAPVTTRYVLGDQTLFESRPWLVRGAIGLIFFLARQNPGRPEKEPR